MTLFRDLRTAAATVVGEASSTPWRSA